MQNQLTPLVHYAKTINKLKLVKRTGWTEFGIPESESVADHSFAVACLAMRLCPQLGLDTDKVTKLALVHDLAEAEIGDMVIARGGVAQDNHAKKQRLEQAAFEQFADAVAAPELKELFDEYEAAVTDEAIFARELDKLEMALQALDYALAHDLDLHEFLVTARSKISHPLLLDLIAEYDEPK